MPLQVNNLVPRSLLGAGPGRVRSAIVSNCETDVTSFYQQISSRKLTLTLILKLTLTLNLTRKEEKLNDKITSRHVTEVIRLTEWSNNSYSWQNCSYVFYLSLNHWVSLSAHVGHKATDVYYTLSFHFI